MTEDNELIEVVAMAIRAPRSDSLQRKRLWACASPRDRASHRTQASSAIIAYRNHQVEL